MKPKFSKITTYFLMTVFVSFTFYACDTNEALEAKAKDSTANKTARVAQEELIYAQHLIQNELNYRVIKDKFTLTLMQREMEINGFDTAENRAVILNRLEKNTSILNFLAGIVGPIGGNGGPIGPPRPGLPCEPTIADVNFMELGERQLQELAIIILGCEPIPEFFSIQKVVFNHDMGQVNNVLVSQYGHQVGGVIESNYDDFDQEILIIGAEYHRKAMLTLFLEMPVFGNLRFDFPIQHNN
jgi:hypothetical protein